VLHQVGVQCGRGLEAAEAEVVDLLVTPGQVSEGLFHAAVAAHRGDGGVDDREGEAAGAQDGDDGGGGEAKIEGWMPTR
jgi:hypothetical protein